MTAQLPIASVFCLVLGGGLLTASQGRAGTTPPVARPLPGPATPVVASPIPTAGHARDGARDVREPPAPPQHALGLIGGLYGGTGLFYRRYFGLHALQVSMLPFIIEGQSSLFWAGLGWTRLLHRWGQGYSPRSQIIPASLGLRLVAGLSYQWQRSVRESGTWDPQTQQITDERMVTTDRTFYAGAGLGIQLGALNAPGISLGVDLVLTAERKNGKLQSLLPLPAADLVYSW